MSSEKEGVQLCARFSIATNRLDYCGPSGAHAILYRAITEGRDIEEARRALAQFEALMPYLESIGAKHGLDPFDASVVEAYWVGNSLLDSFERGDFVGLLDRLVLRGLPRSLAQRMIVHLPAHPIPHHAFHVSFVGVGNVTGHVDTTLSNMEACRPGFGTVETIEGDELRYIGPRLRSESGRVFLDGSRTFTVRLDPRVLPGVSPGDPIATHWSVPALGLDPVQLSAVRRYSLQSFASANEALVELGTLVEPPGHRPE